MACIPLPEIDPCWNRIGVRGTGDCPELTRHVHCRHCPVFSQAAANRLETQPPEGYLDELTRHYAEPRAAVAAGDRSLVVFRLGDEWLGLNARAVMELVHDRFIHSIPHVRNPVLQGLANFRGELVLCVDLEVLLGLPSPAGARDDGSRQRVKMMLLGAPQGSVAVRVAEVAGIERLPSGSSLQPPATLARAPKACVACLFPWRDGHLSCLDEVKLFELINRNLS
jgi:chemotaxis-related protein WspD